MPRVRSHHLLATLLAVMGTAHFVVPGPFDAIIPRSLPGAPRLWTYASGAAEVACAALLAVPATRSVGGYATATLFVAVFPGNVQMAIDAGDGSTLERVVTLARLPLQVPLVISAWRIGRGAGRAGRRAEGRASG